MSRTRAILLMLAFVAIAIAFLFLPVREWFRLAQDSIDALGPLAPAAVTVTYVVLTVLLVPGSALTLGAAALFGFWTAFGVVTVGANVGALCSFLLARTAMREQVVRWAAVSPRFTALDRAIGRDGFKFVLLARLSPVFPFTLLNYLLGLTAVRPGAYVLANLIGMLPGTILYVSVGATTGAALGGDLGAGATPGGRLLLAAGLVATILVFALVTRAARRALAAAELSG